MKAKLIVSPDKVFYQLTFFDTTLNRRRRYLNGSSWPNQDAAEKEFALICKQQKERESRHIYSDRIKWALESVKNKKRVIVKQLN